MRVRLRHRRTLTVGGVLLVTMAFIGGAYGSHVFSDVPTSAFYHNDVTWLASTGITAGCAPGRFCPGNAVTRGQMAVFLHKLVNQTRTGHFSCAGDSFVSDASSAEYATSGSLRYHISGNTVFRCNVVIPDGATITGVTFAVRDNDATADAGAGQLWRTNLTASIGGETNMASTATTGTAATPGATTLTDTSITVPTVDNALWSYFLLIFLDGTNSNVGVYGATVTYTYTGVPAP